jgi:ribosomal protein S18 acetylase RimI-like enzyme
MIISTRPAQQADLSRIAQLFDLYRQFYQQAPDPQLAYDFILERYTKNESVILLAETPQLGIVGFCQMYPSFCSVEAANIYTLYDLFVLPIARKLGAGRQLLVAAEIRAQADGKVRMDLTTAKSNLTAQSLYESLGWIRDDVFYAYSKQVIKQNI